MKNYTVITTNGSFSIAAENSRKAATAGRAIVRNDNRHERSKKDKFEKVLLQINHNKKLKTTS